MSEEFLSDVPDVRMYFKHHDEWTIQIKRDWDKQYCYAKSPGQEFFHGLVAGEIYLQRGDEKYCLQCALRLGYLTLDRLHWQQGPRTERKMPF